MGHSAGGGLAALLTADDALFSRWGVARNPVRGAILDDPAGLDMYDYLKKMQYPGDEKYLVPFGPDPAGWKQVSPLYYLTAHTPPFQLFIGGAKRIRPSVAAVPGSGKSSGNWATRRSTRCCPASTTYPWYCSSIGSTTSSTRNSCPSCGANRRQPRPNGRSPITRY